MVSAKGACSLGSDSARAPLSCSPQAYTSDLRVRSRDPTREPLSCSPQAYTSDLRVRSRDPTQVLSRQCMCGRTVPVMRLVADIVNLLYSQIRHLSLHRRTRNVYGSQGGGISANPFLCGVKGNTVVGMCSPRLAERGGKWLKQGLRHSLLALCQCVP